MKILKFGNRIAGTALPLATAGINQHSLSLGARNLNWKIAATIVVLLWATSAGATIRIASYNIDSQDQGSDNNITGASHSMPTVIQAMGLHHIGSNAQPVDVLGLEEMLTSTTGGFNTTLSDATTALNNIYGAGAYSFDKGTANSEQSQAEGLIYKTSAMTIQSVRILPTGSNVLLQSNGTYTAAHFTNSAETVPRSPMLYRLRPVGTTGSADFYMYVSHARSTSDNSVGDARYAEAQEIRSDAKYNLPAGAHVIYSGDWNLFNGSNENAYKCLTGQATSDGINWADSSATTWTNTNPTQGFDPTSITNPATTTIWTNAASDNANYLYGDSTHTLDSRIDIQLVNTAMLAAYNGAGGTQLAPDNADPYDSSNFPAAKYPYAFEVFGNDGSTTRSALVTSSSNHSLDDLASTTPNTSTVLNDLNLNGSGSSYTGSDHYPVVGDYIISNNAGDFNGDGKVDAADYVTWRKGLGTIYTQNDYNVWRAHFGQTAGSGAGATANGAVPEPATLVLLTFAASGWCLRRRRDT